MLSKHSQFALKSKQPKNRLKEFLEEGKCGVNLFQNRVFPAEQIISEAGDE